VRVTTLILTVCSYVAVEKHPCIQPYSVEDRLVSHRLGLPTIIASAGYAILLVAFPRTLGHQLAYWLSRT